MIILKYQLREGMINMNLENTKVLTTVEYGSTYQGLSDAHSDKDIMNIVLQPFEDTVFGDIRKGSHHNADNDRFYSAERFVNLLLRGSSDNLLVLCAQLEQAKDSEYNQKVLRVFYERDDAFDELVKANLRTYMMSLKGQLYKIIKRNSTQGFTGKDLLKEVVFMNRLNHVIALKEGRLSKPVTYDTLIKDSTLGVDNQIHYNIATFLPLKRMEYDQLKRYIDVQQYIADRNKWFKIMEAKVEQLDFQDDKFKYEYELKSDLVQYLVEKYQN